MNIGMTSVTFRKLNAGEIVRLCAECGLDCIEWGGDVHCPEGDYERAGQLKKLSAGDNILVSSYGSYFYGTETDYIEIFDRVSLTAEVLGCHAIRIWAGKKGYDEASEEEKFSFVSRMREIVGIAKKRNQVVCFEYHKGTLNDSAEHFLNLFASIKKENVRTYFQPIDGERENIKAIELLKEHIENVHVYYWNGNIRLPLSQGQSVWLKYIEKLKKTTAKNLLLEFTRDDDPLNFIGDAETLRNMRG